MKKSILLACIVAIVTSCAGYNEESAEIVEKPVQDKVVQSYNKGEIEQKLLKAGWDIYEMHNWCEDLTIPQEIIDRLDDNNNDLSAVIDMVECLSEQDAFGDTIAETDAWLYWCEYYDIYEKLINQTN